MPNPQPNHNQVALLLPQLKPDCDVKAADAAGKWDFQTTKAFENVASSLDYKAPGEVKSVSSVPTMWARPLSIEMALHNLQHPIRSQTIEQWEGMLAAIALAEVRGFPLTAKLVALGFLKDRDEFARSLYQLVPDPVNTLYQEQGQHPWQDIYIFLWNGKPVGMSSPSTIICPSEEGEWFGLPWWRDGRLHSPINDINSIEKALLWRWLENLRTELTRHNGKRHAVNTIGALIDNFRAKLGIAPDQALTLSDDPQFFGVPINRGVLKALNLPVKFQPKPSNIRLIPSLSKENVPDLLIIDPGIAAAWHIPPQNIWVYGGKTLASLKIEELRSGKIIWQDVRWIEPKDLFLPEFVFIDQEDALPGSFLPNEIQPLAFNGERITPLIPLNPILLEYFTPEDLIRRIQFQPINSNEGSQVRVILDLPLAGVTDGKPPENYRVVKDYPIKEENTLKEVPVLEIWPHFRAKGWKSYYAFYYDAEYGEETFQVSFPTAKEPHIFKDGRGSYQIARLEEFPSVINCQDSNRNLIGLILLKSPEEIQPSTSWIVGVDFGTSFTNIYVNRNGIVEPLQLENLHLKVTEIPRDTRITVLFEYFIPENFIPADKPLPLSSVLTTRGGIQTSQNQVRSEIFDGRIYVPDRNRFEPQKEWIETDLKWKNILLNQLFIKHLALHISAIAAKNRVAEIQWSLSFPSAFSRGDKNRYAQTWKNLTEELQAKTGIKHICPEVSDLDYFRTESLAVAQYFADWERHNLVNTTCIDMGGGTSDISIWEENQLVHQCSVQLAGRDLFSQFLELNPKFLEQKFEVNFSDWRNLRGGSFNAKLDVLLRLEGENWLKYKRSLVEDDPDFQGLIQLTAIGTAGLYYYVGILLKVLHGEGKYNRQEITPVYVGGNGSRFLNWLAEGGEFNRHSEMNDLLSRMLSNGSGFEDTEETTHLSQNPKDEAACGLVLRDSKLQGLKKKARDPLIAGEECILNGQTISWESRLEFEDDVDDFRVPKLVQLQKFLYDFHVGLRELDIEGIKPLKGYKRTLDNDENAKLWRDTNKELTNVLLTMRGNSDNIRVEPPFILGLKALLKVLGKQWADNGKSKDR